MSVHARPVVFALHVTLAIFVAACDSDDGSEAPDTDADGTSSGETLGDSLADADADADGCGPLTCDAIYVPPVRFDFEDESGAAFCGDVTITVQDESGDSSTFECSCEEGEMVPVNGPAFPFCYADAPWGESSTVTVTAAGREPWTTDISLPCECHPQVTLGVVFEPEAGPRPDESCDDGPAEGCPCDPDEDEPCCLELAHGLMCDPVPLSPEEARWHEFWDCGCDPAPQCDDYPLYGLCPTAR
ncbi:MAG: hypothetical protein ACQEXJ_10230 [Myxococcota bacterium]